MSIENPTDWEAPDLTDAQLLRIKGIIEELEEIFPSPTPFKDEAEIANMTEARAYDVLRATRRLLLHQLLLQEIHEHMVDDCGDYLIAATENWNDLLIQIWQNDFGNLIPETQKFLTDVEAYPLGGSDGEIRHDLLGHEGGLAARILDDLG